MTSRPRLGAAAGPLLALLVGVAAVGWSCGADAADTVDTADTADMDGTEQGAAPSTPAAVTGSPMPGSSGPASDAPVEPS